MRDRPYVITLFLAANSEDGLPSEGEAAHLVADQMAGMLDEETGLHCTEVRAGEETVVLDPHVVLQQPGIFDDLNEL